MTLKRNLQNALARLSRFLRTHERSAERHRLVSRGLLEVGCHTCGGPKVWIYDPLHLYPYYRRRWGTRPEDHPVATREYERVISLPIWPGMTGGDIRRVVATLAAILDGSRPR